MILDDTFDARLLAGGLLQPATRARVFPGAAELDLAALGTQTVLALNREKPGR